MPRKSTRNELEQLINEVHNHNINYKDREIYLHGAYSSSDGEPGVEFQMATTFIKNLHVLSNQGEGSILVHMHTIGGEWGDGMGMFHAIRFSKSPIIMLAYAQASSMSGIVLQAADRRILMPDCDFMIHHGSVFIDNNSTVAKSMVDCNERLCKRMLDIFAKRARKAPYFEEREWTDKQIAAFFNRKLQQNSDWYMSAEEAIDYGLADGILGQKNYETMDKIKTFKKYKGVI